MLRLRAHGPRATLLATVLLAPDAARAGTFDAQGTFRFDPRAVRVEGFGGATPPAVGLKILRVPDALEGATSARVDTMQGSVRVPFDLPQTDASYRASLFVRSGRVVADVTVSYPDDGGAPSFAARFYPTGVVTSDGWYEVATNEISVEGSRKPTLALEVRGSGAEIDAFEIVPKGTFRSRAKCSPPRDAACGEGQFCAAGWCRDGAAFVPPLPPPEHRDAVVGYLAGRLQIFFGGRFTRETRLPIALATIEKMRRAGDPWTFWNGWVTAIHQLRDWHTTVTGPVSIGGRGAFPICLVEGDADLSHHVAPKHPDYYDVLVSHVGPTANSGLKPGDRIVAINGVHPIAFVESLEDVDWGAWRADDPTVHAEAVERMPSIIRRWAKTLTIVRCDAQAGTCGAPETLDVSDLPPDANGIQYPYCDHRPGYHLASGNPDPVQHDSYAGPFYGRLAESQPGEELWGAIWNDVYMPDPSMNEYAPFTEAFRANAKGVILDHRLGNGGTVNAAEYLTTLYRTPARIAVWPGFNQTLGMYGPPFSVQDGLSLFNQFIGSDDAAYKVGASNAKTTGMPTALLLARDGSGSDWFPLGMSGLPNVRLFGRPTAGAFSSYFQLDYYGGFSLRFASGDLVLPSGQTQLGTGVAPTEEIVPLQSDLLAGRDTVYLRALEWIRTCTGCK
jgi:hypothetical protein